MTDSKKADIGIIGLAAMGRNFALNISDHEFSVAVWNLEQEVTDTFVAAQPGRGFVTAETVEQLVVSLVRPRRVLIMIKAGKPVDELLSRLGPLLEPGDIVIDGGNSLFTDTQRREKEFSGQGIQFVGMGVSGGEEGARHGPSLMPGCTLEAWRHLEPVLTAIAARTDSGPCVGHVGTDGAGHFVKMVHNGIEYADMQIIAETYDVFARGLKMNATEIGGVFARWNEGPAASFLVDLTAKLLDVRDEDSGEPLVEKVLDKAGQKGTGKWTAQAALDLGVPIPTITAAIEARVLSGMKSQRTDAAETIQGVSTVAVGPGERDKWIAALHDALLASRVCAYAQGLQLIRAGNNKYGWDISVAGLTRIWRGGCIIRARLLDVVMRAYERTPDLQNFLMDPEIEVRMRDVQPGWRRAVGLAQGLGIPVLASSASLAYFDSYRSARLPQNLTQAQRDAFGAHTYERADKPERGFVHSEWLKS
jgi:6-phosphogluconate dehydrogenase